jgi:hypothetical protein
LRGSDIVIVNACPDVERITSSKTVNPPCAIVKLELPGPGSVALLIYEEGIICEIVAYDSIPGVIVYRVYSVAKDDIVLNEIRPGRIVIYNCRITVNSGNVAWHIAVPDFI